MAYIGKGLTNDNLLRYDSTKGWVSAVESMYAFSNLTTSSGIQQSYAASNTNWTQIQIEPSHAFIKGGSAWQCDGTQRFSVQNFGDFAGSLLNSWMEAEVKMTCRMGSSLDSANFAFVVAQASDGVSGTTVYPQREQRVFVPTNSELVHVSFNTALQYNNSGIGILARPLANLTGLSLNIQHYQITIKPL